MASIEKKKNTSQEITINDDINHYIYSVHCHILHDRAKKINGYIILIRDITADKELEIMKSDFISTAAHQLRTPLSSIKWMMKMLLDGDVGKLSTEQNDLLKKGFQRSNEVISMMNNLLGITEIDRDKLPFKIEPTYIDKVLEKLYDHYVENAKQKGITLILEKPKGELPLIRVDLQKINMCVQNLLDNAVKYTAKGGKVILGAYTKDKNIIIKVADSGIGITDEEGVKLFTRFYRGKRAINEEPTGSGLGLYIVKSIILKHGGEVWFESEKDKGTTFYIKLPIKD